MGKYLRAGVLVGEDLQPTATGVPHGSPLSPVLANVRVDDLDKERERRGHRFARYGDDFLIVVKSQRAGDRVKTRLTRLLQQHLKLEIKENKSKRSRISVIDSARSERSVGKSSPTERGFLPESRL
jgi:RNA-directed DNA polymerase